MLYSNKNDLEDRIVELVTRGHTAIKSLHSQLNAGDDLSLRAVYKAVHKLMDAGVLLKVGRRVMIDQEWVRRVLDTLGSVSAPTLSAGERALYTFTSIRNLDAFWKSVVLPLEQSVSAKETFFYNPHNFWAYLPARKKSEDEYYQHFSEKRYAFFTVGGESEADKEFKRAYQNNNLQIELMDIRSLRRTDHITIMGPFIISVRLHRTVSERIDTLYASGEKMSFIMAEILAICGKPGKIRFVIENNQNKADKTRRTLAKNFYFKLSP